MDPTTELRHAINSLETTTDEFLANASTAEIAEQIIGAFDVLQQLERMQAEIRAELERRGLRVEDE